MSITANCEINYSTARIVVLRKTFPLYRARLCIKTILRVIIARNGIINKKVAVRIHERQKWLDTVVGLQSDL